MLKLVFVVLSLCVIGAFCAVARENAPVSDEEKANGYACKSSNKELGLMKQGEEKKNYNPKTCSSASCHGGVITYESCGAIGVAPGCTLKSDLSKPYPDCCPQQVCN